MLSTQVSLSTARNCIKKYTDNSATIASKPYHHKRATSTADMMTSPWGGAKGCVPVVPCSLEDVMSEQLASDLDTQQRTETQHDEWEQFPGLSNLTGVSSAGNEAAAPADCALSDAELAAKLAAEEAGGPDPNDELLARYLQQQFDEEYDAMVEKREKQFNGTSKVSVSFANYKMRNRRESEGNQLLEDDDDEPYEGEYPEEESPSKWVQEAGKTTIGPKGYSGHGKNIVTKHDKVICGRRNAEKLMDMPPGFEPGDGEGMDMQLTNKVFNKLKSHSVADTKKRHKIHEKKDHSTAIKAVDENTRILLYKLINSGYLSSIGGEVSQGKEAVVLHAGGGLTQDENPLPKDVILKVYKTSSMDFHTREKYIYGDHMLSKDLLKKKNPRKIIKIWAEKEFLNLNRMRRANIPCPVPLTLKKNVLVMSCVGGDVPAPKLKDVRLSVEDMQLAYEQVVEIMRCMYHQCGLIHADLSEYNLLWHGGRVWVIDVSQSVGRENANSYDFLLRDCRNICNYFSQAGVYGVPSAEDLYMEITNLSLEGKGKLFTSQMQRYDKEEYSFEYFYDQSEDKRAQDLLRLEGTSSSDSDSDVDEVTGEPLEGSHQVLKASSRDDAETAAIANNLQDTNCVKKSSSNKGDHSQQSSRSTSKPDRWVIECDDDS